MGAREVAGMMVNNNKDKDIIKTQFDPADVAAYFQWFPEQVTASDRGLIISERSIAGDTMIWGNSTFGIWGTAKWGSTPQISFVLGNSLAAVLGTSKLGSQTSAFTRIRVVHPGRRYIDNFNDDKFEDTASTTITDWATNGSISFTTSATASSLTIYKNNETVTTATLNATDSGTITYEMSADTGSNWESVTKGSAHTFTNQGQDLRWRAYSTGSATISSIQIEY